MSEDRGQSKASKGFEEPWYETTLPITLTVILSVILVCLVIVLIVQWCKRHREKRRLHPKEPKAEKHKKVKPIKASKTKGLANEAPLEENNSFLVSGIRPYPTRNPANRSWYDSKLIPYIDEAGASLDNVYVPDGSPSNV
nr:unnamed protein product [Spirometra erinaceieuropaei]